MQSLSPKPLRWLVYCLLASGAGCAATPTPAGGGPPPQHSVARAAVVRATVALRAAQRRRDGMAQAIRRQPSDPCAPLVEQAEATGEAWRALALAWAAYAEAVARAPSRLASARSAEQVASQGATQAQEDAAAWAAWCAARRAVAKPAVSTPHRPERCGQSLLRGPVVNLVEAEAAPLTGPMDTAALLQRLRRDVSADWELVLLFDQVTVAPEAADRALLRVAGRAAVQGADPRHVAGWPSLLGVAPVVGQRMADAPLLRAVLRVMAPARAVPACDQPLQVGWGALAVGGQLGGPAPTGLQADGQGWRLIGPGGRPAGRLANGGDAVPYAPVELTLLGLASVEGVRAVPGLKAARPGQGGRWTAAGRCEAAPAELVGPAPGPRRSPGPFRVGVVIRTRAPLAASALGRWADELAEFTSLGPDALPDRLNFHEATGGLGRLWPVAARPAAACGEPAAALPSRP